MEQYIFSGRVKVNGKIASTGQRVGREDKIMLDERPIFSPIWNKVPRVLLYNKPEGEIVTRNDPNRRISSFDKLPKLEDSKWISVGRLDFNSSGLLIFTTSGALANKLMHPSNGIEKEYLVRANGLISPTSIDKLLLGIDLDDGFGRFDKVDYIRGKHKNIWYRIIVSEGRNRFIRRMLKAVNLCVTRLKRVRVGNIVLPERLAQGNHYELSYVQMVDLNIVISQLNSS